MANTGLSLVDFLLARITDDEAEVEGHCFDYTVWDTGLDVCRHASHKSGYTSACYKARGHKRTMAECAAKRKIVDRFLEACQADQSSPSWATVWLQCYDALKIVGSVYADHPDFEQRWVSS